MNAKRPTVSPQLVASMIESTPDRVRSRLDRTPTAAATWSWEVSAEAWSVQTGAETVTLPHGHVAGIEQLACTCLLAPRCFHVLACLTSLEVATLESLVAEPIEEVESPTFDESVDVVEPEEKQRRSARELVSNVAKLLQIGVANAGVVVQSGLLRAVHQCRADGLHRLAGLGLRVVAGTSEFRARAATSDPAQLAEDAALLLETSRHVQNPGAIASFWIGTARRKQMPVRPRKLHGLFAEPVITRSGFSGAAVYFLGEDDRIYTASDVRPGDALRARDAYSGGIEMGTLVQPAKQLARGAYLGSDLTASGDGRLGRGKGIKLAQQGESSWQAEVIAERFRRSLADQWNGAFRQAALPADVRPAGWDFVFVSGTVMGALGPQLLFKPESHTRPIRLAIENESETMHFRENLRMLSHAPGLQLQIIARVNLQEPTIMAPLAAAPMEGNHHSHDVPRLEIPQSFAGRLCLGFDEIQPHFLINSRKAPIVFVSEESEHQSDPLCPLRRRWIAAILSGLDSQRAGNVRMLAAEMRSLDRLGFATGAALLDALSSAPSETGPSGIDTFLAAAIYLRTCGHELAAGSLSD